MAESSLTLSFSDCADRVARFLGYPEGDGNRTALQNNDVDRAIKSGYRRFLYPPTLPGHTSQHKWSFLEPVVSVTTVADDYTYNVPADFSHLVGAMVLDESPYLLDGNAPVLDVIGTAELQRLRSLSKSSGTPSKVAFFNNHEDSSSQPQFWLYPTPDKAYKIHYRYSAEAVNPSSGFLGGQAHSETLMSAILAAAEEHLEESSGVHHGRFLEQLSGSIEHDRRNGEQFFGYNGDPGSSRIVRRLQTITHVNDV